jgi:hypothetical protein
MEDTAAFREALAQVKQSHSNLLTNISKVVGEKGTRYSWINRDKSRVAEMQALGYKLVTSEDKNVESNWKQKDGSHTRGDVVLMKIPEMYAQALDYFDQERATSGLEDTKTNFREFADTNNAPVHVTGGEGDN